MAQSMYTPRGADERQPSTASSLEPDKPFADLREYTVYEHQNSY